uniref:BZIP domain-containing protein n=1 Tax=Leersia perrieri TaxID=77586 RepID=A0A0D9XQE4_9ORYZ
MMMAANAKLPKQALLPPRSPFPTAAAGPYAGDHHGPIARPQGGNGTHHRHHHGHGHHGHHQRTSSESFIEEQPSWLDDLLNEPESPVRHHGGRAGHRRSSSDSFALFDGGAGAGAYANGFEGIGGQAAPWGGVPEYYAKPGSFGRHQSRPWEQGINNLGNYRQGGGPPMPAKEKVGGGHHGSASVLRDHDHGMDRRSSDESGHDQKVGAERKEGVPPKHVQSEADTKRAKQQYAQRSRVRKLQYIAELERTVQSLQSDGIDVSAEMEFLSQQNIMLDLENKALKQRLESLAQEQLIKRFQQEMFEREIGRLRSLYQQQQQQKQPQPTTLSRSNSRDLDSQFANLSLKHKDPNSARDAVSGSLRT